MQLRPALAAVVLLLVTGACGGTADTQTSDFASVEHEFGTTTIERKPERIAVLGVTEQDIVLQLGYTPVAITEWYGEQPDATWPWAQELLGDAKPTVLQQRDGIDFEALVGTRPDLIIAANAGLDRETYTKLAKIAPTIAQPRGGTQYFSRWDEITVIVAEALGKKAEGEKLVDDVKARYAGIAAEHPEWEGSTATFAQGAPYDGLLYVYPDGLNTEFLSYLGFTMTPGLEKKAPGPGTQAEVSAENLDIIDADVVLFATERESDLAKLEAMPTFGRLGAVQEKRAVYTDATLAGAIYFMTPLSLDYVADRLPPLIEKAFAGTSPRSTQG